VTCHLNTEISEYKMYHYEDLHFSSIIGNDSRGQMTRSAECHSTNCLYVGDYLETIWMWTF